MSAPEKILQLVERFDTNSVEYKQGKYNETQTRREFIDPFFKALGWDIDNESGQSELSKDVIHEDAIKVEKATKAPDYCFRIGGARKFFVEAKKPSVAIKDDIHPAYQLRCYGWNAKLPISILTDFEEFAVYDCRIPPEQRDKATHARLWYITYNDYVEKWDDFVNLFSRDAIANGSLEQYAEAHKDKRGSLPVDVAFLQEIEQWRDRLARHLAARNPGLTRRDLNYAVQRTIDRIIFLRICEGRGIEPYGRLQNLLQQSDIYPLLLKRFTDADAKYNSGIFHFKPESGQQDPPDTLTPNLTIDDDALKSILKRLYYPDSPYLFEVIPAEILGQVYEQFLGKVICLDSTHQATVEDKPEVKKAGGVYYTPAYIVDYIVKQTVGELLKNKDLTGFKNLRGLTLTILDPACGSGSFLLGAYQYLLDWHREQYIADDPKKWSKSKPPRLRQIGNDWKLTIAERKRILLAHIYGVDIDAQAVEVTKLSLLLKVLEGEDEQSVGQMGMFHERVLPNLSQNIKCGNSLIGWDFYEGQQLGLMDEEERYRINAFDWTQEFPAVMQSGGFDAVIGNPPYIRIQTMKEWAPLEVEFYKKRYISASKGNYDIYVVFIERAFTLLNKHGKLGFILPHKFFQAQFGQPIRQFISEKKALHELVHFGSEQVFKNATTYTCLLFLSAVPSNQFKFVAVNSLNDSINLFTSISNSSVHPNYKQSQLQQISENSSEWNFYIGGQSDVLAKLKRQPLTLGDITRKIFVGLQTSADKIYVLKIIEQHEETIVCYSQSLEQTVEIERGLLKLFLMGKDIHRYDDVKAKNVVIFPYIVEKGKAILMSSDFIQQHYPKGWQYLIANKDALEGREKGKMKGDNFYAYIYPKNLAEFEVPKLMTPEIALGCQLTFDAHGRFYHTTKIYSFIFNDTQKEDLFFYLGVLNSKLLWFFLKSTGYTLRGGYFTFKTEYLKPFPIRTIDFSNYSEKAQHDKIVELVQRILDLHTQLVAAQNPQAQTMLQRQIAALDGQIDRLVYALYGLTEEEIKIVEGGA